LALGLFLGSTSLQSAVTRNLHHQANQVTSANQRLTAERDLAVSQLGKETAFVRAVASYAVAGHLTGDAVAVVSAPGVSNNDRQAVETALGLAGATVTADVQIQPAYLDPTQDGVLGGLATQLALPGRALPRGNGSTQASAVLAAVLAARPGRTQVSRINVESTLSALSDGKFIKVAGNAPTHAATLTVLLASPPDPNLSPQMAQTQNTILLALASQLRGASTGVVMAGETPTPLIAGGTLAAARGDAALSKTISTVELRGEIDPVAGPVAVVLALADAAKGGKVGDFGLGQAQPVPTPSTSP
jgi:hypothetical protein